MYRQRCMQVYFQEMSFSLLCQQTTRFAKFNTEVRVMCQSIEIKVQEMAFFCLGIIPVRLKMLS